MLGVCIDCFAHSCDQVSDRKQLKGGRFYLSSGFEYYIMVGKAWQQETGGRNIGCLLASGPVRKQSWVTDLQA